jgi:hypothetical protein
MDSRRSSKNAAAPTALQGLSPQFSPPHDESKAILARSRGSQNRAIYREKRLDGRERFGLAFLSRFSALCGLFAVPNRVAEGEGFGTLVGGISPETVLETAALRWRRSCVFGAGTTIAGGGARTERPPGNGGGNELLGRLPSRGSAQRDADRSARALVIQLASSRTYCADTLALLRKAAVGRTRRRARLRKLSSTHERHFTPRLQPGAG